MRRIAIACVLLAAACGGSEDPPELPPDLAAVQRLARVVAEATVEGDVDTIFEHTHEGLIRELGGREEAIRTTKASLEMAARQGMRLKSVEVGTPGKLLEEGDHTFVVVPTVMDIDGPTGGLVAHGYLLGISPDGGKTWKFVDGYGLDEKIAARALPKLPPDLELPEIRVERR